MRKQGKTRPYKPVGFHAQLNSFIFYALLLLIVLCPIPYGSNRAWSWSLCAIIISVLSLIWIFNALWDQRNISLSLPPIIIVLFLIPGLWSILQVSGFMPEAWFHPLWAMTADALNASIPPGISLTPDMSITALMRLLSYGLVFFLTFQFCRNPHRAHTTLTWLAAAGILYALYGLVLYWSDIDVIKTTSTFINRNTYAAYAGLGLVCLMALSLLNSMHRYESHNAPPSGRGQRIETYIYNSWKPLLGLMLITTGLISTQSRGGAIASAIGIFTLLFIYLIRTKANKKMLLASLGGGGLIIFLAYSISNEALLGRMVQVETGGSERIVVYKLTMDATGDNPLTGFGYGAFDQGFKLYRSEDVQYIYDKAHNSYLENSFELGIPATVCLFLSLLGLFWLCLRGAFRRQRNWLYPATGLAATTLVASHSLIDFSLQIPAVAITYSAIMGLAVAQSFSSTRHHV